MNRSLSIRSRRDVDRGAGRHRFSMATLRGMQQPELSKRLFKIIKNENSAIGAYEAAGRERVSIATQLSEWGESTGDDAISDLSDKLGVLLSEIGEQEDLFAQNLEDYRSVLKQIRNTEGSVQPSREFRARVADEIQRQKWKDPSSPRLVSLEQELVRAEAQNLVAEAQLTNITRQKFKEAYDLHLAATIERAEKQIILARHGRRLLNLLDDTPVVPGDPRRTYERGDEARQILNDAEEDLRSWERTVEPIPSGAAELGANLMPITTNGQLPEPTVPSSAAQVPVSDGDTGEQQKEEAKKEEQASQSGFRKDANLTGERSSVNQQEVTASGALAPEAETPA